MFSQSGGLSRSPLQTLFIERKVSYHIGYLQGRFELILLDENMVDTMDEAHFILNMDNHKTLSSSGGSKINYDDMVSVCDWFTMALRFRGSMDAKLM